MFKPSVTIHRAENGDVKVLECSLDADVCVKAYKECTEPGEVVYIRKGHTDKQKKIQSKAEIENRANHLVNMAKTFANARLIQAEKKLKELKKQVKKASSIIDELKGKKPGTAKEKKAAKAAEAAEDPEEKL